jgi:hypothetical protein
VAVAVVVDGLDFGAPGWVFLRVFTAHVVRVEGFTLVGHDAVGAEFFGVVEGYAGG